MTKRHGFIIGIILLASASVSADVTVNPSGGGDYLTIQEGIDAATAGETVLLADGTYTGTGNRDLNFSGKAITVQSASNDREAVIINCNASGRGFLFNHGEGSGSVLRSITITGGKINDDGAGIYIYYSSPTITDCTITNCSNYIYLMDGAGISIYGNSTTTIQNCTISNNHADGGGGISVYTTNTARIINSIISGNRAETLGGGIYQNGTLEMTNCLIVGNDAPCFGGGLSSSGNAVLTNCTIARNTGDDSSGMYWNQNNISLINCIIAYNLVSGYNYSATLSYCCIDDTGCPGTATCNNCIFDEPGFVGGSPYDYHIRTDSPCFDSGTNDNVSYPTLPVDDFEGDSRPSAGDLYNDYDMGADEWCAQGTDIILSPGSGEPAIQDVIDHNCNNDILTIWLNDGTYSGEGNRDIDFRGWNHQVRSISDNPSACIIDCESSGRGFRFSSGETTAVISGLTVRNGHVSNNGGGIEFADSGLTPIITNCVFENCDADSRGGAMAIWYGSHPTVENCIFQNNSANQGGALFIQEAAPLISRCIIDSNTCSDLGGGIYCRLNGTDPIIVNCIISNNSADWGGGIAFYQNFPTVTNCTIVNNYAGQRGGGILNYSGAFELVNCILWGNTAGVSEPEVGLRSVSVDGGLVHCAVNGSSCPSGANCTACLFNQDPLFVSGSDYHLTTGSPMIDQGTADTGTYPDLPSDDVDGDFRYIGSSYDIGADETCRDSITVNSSGTGDAATIQEGIDEVCRGGTVFLEDGVYTGPGNKDLDFRGKDIILRSISDDPAACVIDCQNDGRGFNLESGETTASVIRGLKVSNGNKSTTGDNGGGIRCYQSAVTIENCIFINCTADNDGGGLYFNDSDPILTQCEIRGNTAVNGDGGGVFLYDDSDARITNCVIVLNETGDDGGGICCRFGGSPVIVNCTISHNQTGPSTSNGGGGIYCNRDGAASLTPQLINCIIYGNSAGYNNEIHVTSGSPTADFCDFGGSTCPAGVTCTGCLFDQDPLYQGGSPYDYHLTSTSPCMDTGTSDSVTYPDLPSDDFDGRTRPVGLNYDIGAFEFCWSGDMTINASGTGDFPTIENGITYLCSEGNTIWLEDGVFTGDENKNLDFLGKTLTIRSVSNNPEQCIIDCENSGRGFDLDSGETVSTIIQGITIRNGNSGTASGGGIRCQNASPSIINCIIEYCQGDKGGGIALWSESNAAITGCSISGNTAADDGGAVYLEESSPIITKCFVDSNAASDIGGGIYSRNTNSLPQISNCVITSNTGNWGGGLAFYLNSPEVANCTLADNHAIHEGGGVSAYSASPKLVNCIIWGNTAVDAEPIIGLRGSGSAPSLDYCDIDDSGCPSSVSICTSCLYNLDPAFTGGSPCDYHLTFNSACIDQGTDDTLTYPNLPVEDIDSELRPINSGYDIGADEAPELPTATPSSIPTSTPTSTPPSTPTFTPSSIPTATPSITPSTTPSPTPTDTPETTPACVPSAQIAPDGSGDFATIQGAIDVICEGGIILLADGTYSGSGNTSICFNGKNLVLCSSSGDPDLCIIDCENNTNAFNFYSGETPSAVIRGITIRNGNAGSSNGGGFWFSNSSPSIINCVIENCRANRGGGIALYNGSNAAITNCRFIGNLASDDGGGIFFEESSPLISKCDFDSNTASDIGGGVYSRSTNSLPQISNCIITNNTANWGGGIAFYLNSPEVANCTIADNHANQEGGGISAYSASPTLVNCIIWGNTADGAESIIGLRGTGSEPTLDYCDLDNADCPVSVFGCTACLFNQDPLFAGGIPFDYHLTFDSACIDQGTDDDVTYPNLPEDDIDGELRPINNDYDIGADEAPEFPTSTPTEAPTSTPSELTPTPGSIPSTNPLGLSLLIISFSGILLVSSLRRKNTTPLHQR